jgi:hypothetical protein
MSVCPSCRGPLPLEAISASIAAARCPSCRTLIDLAEKPKAIRPALAIPEKWVVDAQPGALTMRWRWFSLAIFFLIPFALAWNGFMVGLGYSATDNLQHPERLLFGLVLPHAWVGVGLAYYIACLLLNATTVTWTPETIAVRHGPLWWPGNRQFGAREVKQLFVVEKKGGKGSVNYELFVLDASGRRQQLVRTDDAQQARFLELRLELALGLADERVEGEFRR